MIWRCKSSYWKCAIVTTTCHKGAWTLLRQLASEHPVWKAFSKNPIQMDYVPVTCAVHAYCVFVLLIFRFNIHHLIPSSTNHNSEFPCIWSMQWIQYHCWKLNVPVACWHYPRQRTQQHLQKLSLVFGLTVAHGIQEAVTNKQCKNNNSHENQETFILMIKKARTRPKLFLKIKRKTSK
jgi:hypothetical protein